MKSPRSRRHGAALIIVLASLIFLAALVLAFLSSVRTELRSSKAYSAGANAKLLSQSAINLAMAQINDATSGTNGSGTVAWASQPGMIRTYDSSGNAANYYKLFSWTDMSGTGAYDPTLATNTVPANWSSLSAIFTDLNQPLQVPDGATNRTVYPIIDGNGLSASTDGGKTYMANGAPAIDGFSISSAAPIATTAANPNPIPMPVKWLYVLGNGKIVAPDPTGNTSQASVPGATDANPIVGRVAFWADDETCKININTAAEGTYADMPRATLGNSGEAALAKYQPVQGEYQRYPGHPAMTSLSTVLKKPSSGTTDNAWAEQIYGLVPRVQAGGSHEATVLTTGSTAAAAISADADRLFASVDELAFKPTLSGADRIDNSAMGLTKDVLPRDRFFLTPYSRAPDVNLFNKPRVSIWPIFANEDSAHLSAFDKLMAFCTKINGKIYFFQREDSNDPNHDLPSTGASTGLGRNRSLLEYLRSLMGTNIPGFGGNFRAKYGSDTDQILTEIFDYIRCTNLADNTLPVTSNRFTKAVSTSNGGQPGLGQVIPIEDTTTSTRGFGRFRTVQGAALHFIANADGDDATSQKDAAGAALAGANKVSAGHRRVQVMFLLQLFDPSVGAVFDNPNLKWRVSGLNNLQWGSSEGMSNMSFQGDGAAYTINQYPYDGAYFGDQMGINQLTGQTGSKYTATKDFPNTEPIIFSGGDVTVELMNSAGTVVQTVVVNLPAGSFPLPTLCPVPVQNFSGGGTANFRYFTNRISNGASKDRVGAWILDQDVIRSVGPVSGDVRLIAARKNTPLPGQAGYPFGKINDGKWESATAGIEAMHTLHRGDGEPYYGANMGSLLDGAIYETSVTGQGGFSLNSATNRRPDGLAYSAGSDAPFGTSGVTVGRNTAYSAGDLVGDWDNGPANVRDGPFINKPDEGSQGGDKVPYDWSFGLQDNYMTSPTLFTPNRLIPSAATFGSLPTGVLANRPWQTLLFRFDPTKLHPGNKGRTGSGAASSSMPADHLLLDLFTMPVVEPYAISEPLSTAGRINMNYQIVPFTYINRDTGIRAILKSEKVIAIKDADASIYKKQSTPTSDIRFSVDIDETLRGFQARFAANDIFRSPSEICDLPLVPTGFTYDNLTSASSSYWTSYRLTGDNSRERPYATIYPRLTTKSNTYTIYYRVQSLKKVKGGNAAIWDESKDKVLGEARGYQTVERYVDPQNTNIPDYANLSETTPIGAFYKLRVLQSKQFSP